MKAYTYYTGTHEQLLNDWLRESLPAELELVPIEGKQECPSGTYHQAGWNQCMLNKVKLCLRAIDETFGDAFIHLDTDIQFFGPVRDTILTQLETFDFVAQDDSAANRKEPVLCGGFFACRSNRKTRSFWEQVLEIMLGNPSMDDQVALNRIAKNSQLRFTTLPRDRFWSPRRPWKPGRPIHPPRNILMHHANWTEGINNKIDQLKSVQVIVESANNAVYLGTDYGGYYFLPDNLSPQSVVYSFGVGEDASFEKELTNRINCQVHCFDPTPRSIEWAKEHLGSDPRVKFFPIGVNSEAGSMKLFFPKRKDYVSCSIVPISNQEITVEAKRLCDIQRELNDSHIDLIKLDIEGAEHSVIDDMIECEIFPKQIIVEFHDRITGRKLTQETIAKLFRHGYLLFKQNGSDHSFVRYEDR